MSDRKAPTPPPEPACKPPPPPPPPRKKSSEMQKRYEIPKGTPVIRGRPNSPHTPPIPTGRKGYITGHNWENVVTTKDAYYTEKDMRRNDSYMAFAVPDSKWDVVEVETHRVIVT